MRRGYGEEMGDAYCFTAIERHTKLLLAWHLGKRTPESTMAFAEKLDYATAGRFQLTTDGFRPYLNTIPHVFRLAGGLRDVGQGLWQSRRGAAVLTGADN